MNYETESKVRPLASFGSSSRELAAIPSGQKMNGLKKEVFSLSRGNRTMRSQHHAQPNQVDSAPPSPWLASRPMEDPARLEEPPLSLQAKSAGIHPGNHLAHISIFPPVQAKLTVGAPDDPYEQEADRVADQVMSMAPPAPVQRLATGAIEVQRDPLAATITPLVQRAMEEEEEPLQAKAMQRQTNSSNAPTLETRLNQSQGGGSPLPSETRSFMESRFGTDFSQVRIHTDSASVQMNQELSAQAFTHGRDVYFGAGKFDPSSDSGKHLLAHELTHVVQQTGSAQRKLVQRAIGPQHDLTQGTFTVSATPQDAASGGPNVPIRIKFTPKPTARYSNQIGLIQIVRLTRAGGGNVEPQSLPSARGASLRTQTTDGTGVEAGYFTDVLHNPTATSSLPAGGANQGDSLAPQYPFGSGPAQPNPATPGLSRPNSSGAGGAIIGYKRSSDPGDIKAAELTDAPGGNGEFNFEFETVAKGEDTNVTYGALKWGFQIRSGKIQNDTSSAVDNQSATFDAALERHRDFYVHEPVIFYFDFDSASLSSTEIAKIASVKAYLARFSTAPNLVQVTPTGFADQRGNAQYNLNLSLRRATAVREALTAQGIPEAQIKPVTIGSGRGATTDFTQDAATDQDREANRRGNRRVVLTFAHVTGSGGTGGSSSGSGSGTP